MFWYIFYRVIYGTMLNSLAMYITEYMLEHFLCNYTQVNSTENFYDKSTLLIIMAWYHVIGNKAIPEPFFFT